MRLLVVEDVNIMLRLIANTLKNSGYKEIFEARNGSQAIKILEQEKIDIVITDWYMPKLDGLELVKYIRNSDELKEIPIIMLTTRSERRDILLAQFYEVNGYIVKPFSADKLNEKINEIFDKYKTFDI